MTPEERATYWYDACEQQEKLIRTWRIALQTIANGDDGRWGRIALEALDKEKPCA